MGNAIPFTSKRSAPIRDITVNGFFMYSSRTLKTLLLNKGTFDQRNTVFLRCIPAYQVYVSAAAGQTPHSIITTRKRLLPLNFRLPISPSDVPCNSESIRWLHSGRHSAQVLSATKMRGTNVNRSRAAIGKRDVQTK